MNKLLKYKKGYKGGIKGTKPKAKKGSIATPQVSKKRHEQKVKY